MEDDGIKARTHWLHEDYTKEIHLTCQCGNVGHMTVVSLEEDLESIDGFGPNSELMIHSQLSHYLPLWKRIWVAFKYVIGWRDEYTKAHWDVCLVREEDVPALIEMLEHHQKSIEYIKNWKRERLNK